MKKTHKSDLGNVTQKWVDMLMPFTTNYAARISASELARQTSVPQQTASRQLDRLVQLNLIKYTRVGKNKLFYFDLNTQTAMVLLGMVESFKVLQFYLAHRDISLIVDDILAHCSSAIVFGSYASGDFAKESDLDIVLFDAGSKKLVKKSFQKYSTEINEHYVSYTEFSKLLASRNPLAIEIMKNHVIFGDISRIVNIFAEAAA